MQKLYFIRHGQTADNVNETFSTPGILLNDKGRAQAVAAGQKAHEDRLHFDLIISSPYPRALETAQIIAEETGYPKEKIETDDRLVERSVAGLTGTTYESFFGNDKVYEDIDDVPGVEKIERVQERAGVMLQALKHRPEHSILVVSHAAFGRALRRVVLGIPYTDEYIESSPHDPVPNATIMQLI